jgi:hypothetical protein
MPQDSVYTVKITNSPDGDGDYAARIYVDGSMTPAKTFYDKVRDGLEDRAREWVETHRLYDADNVETIQL